MAGGMDVSLVNVLISRGRYLIERGPNECVSVVRCKKNILNLKYLATRGRIKKEIKSYTVTKITLFIPKLHYAQCSHRNYSATKAKSFVILVLSSNVQRRQYMVKHVKKIKLKSMFLSSKRRGTEEKFLNSFVENT